MSVKLKTSKGKEKAKPAGTSSLPSVNWLALQKKFSKSSTKNVSDGHVPPKKRRRTVLDESSTKNVDKELVLKQKQLEEPTQGDPSAASTSAAGSRSGPESIENLRRMVLGELTCTDEQEQPGKYLALDCEMVGVGPDGAESSLARASLVNYHGAVILDVFVRQRERVTDYRTAVSGVRESDMVHARPFAEVQKMVADLIKDRILVGHAVNNDLKALLLSHPRPLLRDTQLCAGKARILKTKYPALRKLAAQELGVTIQRGEHSSVTDARATMALYRLHRADWEQRFNKQFAASVSSVSTTKSATKGGKRKASSVVDNDGDYVDVKGVREDFAPVTSLSSRKKDEVFPGGGRRGVSSGLSVIKKRLGGGGHRSKQPSHTGPTGSAGSGEKWWKTL